MASGSEIRWQSGRPCYFENSSRFSGCNENREQCSGVANLISTRKWLQTNGLRRQKLDLFSLLPKIGFKLSDDYELSLKKPVCSRYGNGLFPQVFRADGHTFNIVCCKEKLVQVVKRLQNAATCLKERLHWLTSGSRRTFGVIEEKCVCIVVASRTDDKDNFALLKTALQMLIEDQVSQLNGFNIMFASINNDAFHTESVSITHDTVHKIIEWIKKWSLPIYYTSTCICEAVLKALEDKSLESVYLLCEGTAVHSCQELLRNKVLQQRKRIPVHINTFNCNDKRILAFLKKFSQEAGGRFHVYETYKGSDEKLSTEINDMALYRVDEALCNKRMAGKATSVASREDAMQLFSELEEARNTIRHIQHLIETAPVRKSGIGTIDSSEMFEAEEENEDLNEDSMCSKEWLSRYGIGVHGLEMFDLLEGVAFKHKEGVIDLLLPPRDPDIRTSAVSKETPVKAKYCENFPAIQWKSGQTVHVHVTPQVQRNYEERMLIVLNAVQQRLNWLRKGSRAVFGNVFEDEVYLVIDMSSSMEQKIPDVSERIESLLQEQLQHKKKLNIVTFNKTAYAWKERLTEVTPKNILDSLAWLKRQSCGGSTNTYAALKIALADPNTQGIYLLTDGRPDQPPRAILAQVQMRPSVPIHTIAFNCNDEEANRFLYQLASSTGGRYHYYTNNDYNIQPPESWKCEDLRLLEEELERGYRSLGIVSRLRQQCLISLWKGEIKKLQSCKCNDVSPDGSVDSTVKEVFPSQVSWSTTRPHSSSTPRVHQTRHSLLQWPFVPSCCKRNQHEHMVNVRNRNLHAGSTKTSRLRHKIALKRPVSSPRESHCSRDKGDKEEREEQELNDENPEGSVELQTLSDIDMEVEKVVLPKKQNINGKDCEKQCSMPIKSWLKLNKLSAKRLTIMDALSPTLIPHKATNVPSINKRVLSKVFDEVFPLAHVMRDKNMQMTLVNPKGVDLGAYEKKLQKAIKLYMSFLDNIIWKALPECAKKKFGSEKPLPFLKNKARLLAALRENNWPVAAEDIALLEHEIEQGFKYLQMSQDLKKSDLGLGGNDIGTETE